MNLLRGVGEFFAMDVGTNSLRMVQLSGDAQRGWTLQKFAYVPLPNGALLDGGKENDARLGKLILETIAQAKISTKNIAVGVPAQKTFTAIVEVPKQDSKLLAKTIKYQMDQYIPMSIEEAKADFVVLGDNPVDPTKVDVLISSTAKSYAESRLDMIESLGLNVIALEPEPIAMARALMPLGAMDARMIVDLGEKSTDLVMFYKGAPRLVRSIPGGFESCVRTVATTLSVSEEQSRQFILKFGLAQDKIEGQVFRALDGILSGFAAELTKSVNFFQGKYVGAKVDGIILSGYAEIVPFIAEYIEAKTGIATTKGNPWQLVRVSPEQKQALMAVSSEFAVAIGLAERSNA